jgi:beta-galactosidase
VAIDEGLGSGDAGGGLTADSTPSLGWPDIRGGLVYGGDYAPEQWDESVWHEDVELMRRAGVNLVNLGMFTWSLLEPVHGRYDFGVLDRVMDLLHEGGILADLATPTAAPPAWLVHRYPDMQPVTADGHHLGLGARESFCPSSPQYREAAASIASVLADRYGNHSALAMWHVGNEFGAHVGPCYCPVSADAFRCWLVTRYGSLQALNEAWGTTFWGQGYSEWDQVGPPRRAPMPSNPAQQLDFVRFSSEEYLACYRNERDVLRARTPMVPITTNFMATSCKHIDYWQWVDEVDIVANDHYLIADDPRNHVDLAMAADLTRSLARGKPWLLMEHSTGAVNWQPRNIAKLPGELRRNSLTHVARGSDGAMFFQWRASRFGAEKFHSAMVPHAGTASRTWQEVCELGADLHALSEIRGSTVKADVALVWDWPSWWALELEYRPSADLSFRDRMVAFYGALWDEGITVDFVPPGADLSPYAVVIAPSLYMISDGAAANVRRYVEAGGTLLVSFFSGIVDEHDRIHPGAHPGGLRDLLGITIEEFHPLRAGELVELTNGDHADVWSERIHSTGAQVQVRFVDGPDAGEPAITRNEYAAGRAWYVGTRLAAGALGSVVRDVLRDAAVQTDPDRPSDVETVRRSGPDASFLFVINHDLETEATVRASGVDLLTGQRSSEKVVVPPAGVAVIKEEAAPL